MPLPPEFELCCETPAACEAAAAGGADRIELCTALDLGGVTPPLSLLRESLTVGLPVHVLIRPRPGNFCYDAREFTLLCTQVDEALAHGAAGVVLGMLTPDRQIDLAHASQLRKLTADRPLTFHRAFDLVPAPDLTLAQLLDLGYDRVLTSGGAAHVVDGLPALRSLTTLAAGRIRIAAGGGVRLDNIPQLAAIPGLDLHASLRRFDECAEAHPLASELGRPYRVPLEDVRAAFAAFHTARARSLL